VSPQISPCHFLGKFEFLKIARNSTTRLRNPTRTQIWVRRTVLPKLILKVFEIHIGLSLSLWHLSNQVRLPRPTATHMLGRADSSNLRMARSGMHKRLKGAQTFPLYTLTSILTDVIGPGNRTNQYGYICTKPYGNIYILRRCGSLLLQDGGRRHYLKLR
jgi:hypothetical protein